MIRGVGDSLYQQYAESATLWLNNTGSRRLSASLIRGVDDSPHHRYGELAIEFFIRRLAVSVIRRVVNSAYRWYGESPISPYRWVGKSPTPLIVDTESRWIPVSLSRGVDDSVYWWYGESLVEKKICLASIFSTLNGWRWPLKDKFGQKLARDVIYYQNRII
jgi:hypothetical protein